MLEFPFHHSAETRRHVRAGTHASKRRGVDPSNRKRYAARTDGSSGGTLHVQACGSPGPSHCHCRGRPGGFPRATSSRIRPCRRRAAARARRALYGRSRPAFRVAVHPGLLFTPRGSRVKGICTQRKAAMPLDSKCKAPGRSWFPGASHLMPLSLFDAQLLPARSRPCGPRESERRSADHASTREGGYPGLPPGWGRR